MNRRTRIGIATGIAITLVGLFVAFVGVPLIASFFMPAAPVSNGIDDIGVMMDAMTDAMGTASSVAETSRMVSIFALLVALAAFVYTMFVLAMWFVNSAPTQSN